MHTNFFSAALALLLAANASAPTVPFADCLISGPTIDNGVNPAPTISDTGTMTGTAGAGCDKCTVTWNVTITWNHTGSGSWLVNGVLNTDNNVSPGDTQNVQTQSTDIRCSTTGPTTATVSATNNAGGQSSVTVTCNQCQ